MLLLYIPNYINMTFSHFLFFQRNGFPLIHQIPTKASPLIRVVCSIICQSVSIQNLNDWNNNVSSKNSKILPQKVTNILVYNKNFLYFFYHISCNISQSFVHCKMNMCRPGPQSKIINYINITHYQNFGLIEQSSSDTGTTAVLKIPKKQRSETIMKGYYKNKSG